MKTDKPSKLAPKIAEAFAIHLLEQPKNETWGVQKRLPSGMNWAVRIVDGNRHISCWRTATTVASDLEAKTMAKHAGFTEFDLEYKTNPTTGVTAVYVLERRQPPTPTVKETPKIAKIGLIWLKLAELNYPRLEIRPGTAVMAGEDNWRKFLRSVNDAHLEWTWAALNNLDPEWSRLPSTPFSP